MEENDDKRYRVWARGWKPILSELSTIIVSNTASNYNTNGGTTNVGNNGGDISNPSWDIKTKALIVSVIYHIIMVAAIVTNGHIYGHSTYS